MKPRTFTSHASNYVLVLHESAREPGRYQLTKMRDGQPVSHTTWDRPELAEKSARGVRVRGQPAAGLTSYVEEVAPEPLSALGWVEDLRRRGFSAFSWDAFRQYFAGLPEADAVALLWSAVGRLWRWDGDYWVVIHPPPPGKTSKNLVAGG